MDRRYANLKNELPDAVLVDDPEALVRYSHDWWPLAVKRRRMHVSEFVPDFAVLPRSVDEVVAVVRYAAAHGIPVTPWGLGSSVTGSPLPTRRGIVVDLSELVGRPAIDAFNHTVTVPAGVRGDELEDALRREGFTLGHSPQSLDRSTVGGWLATLATGQLSSRFGGIEDLLVGFVIVLPDGKVADLRQHPRGATGSDLRRIFLGSEGTLGIFVEATLRIFPRAPHRVNEAFTVPDVSQGLAALRSIAQGGLRPAIVRLYDEDESVHASRGVVRDTPVVFLSSEGLPRVASAEHSAAADLLLEVGARSLGPALVEDWFERRYDFSTVERVLGTTGGFAETIEVAAPWSDIAALYDALRANLSPLADEVLGHFSHVYTHGTSLYVILLGEAGTDEEAAERIQKIWDVAMHTTRDMGGILSHHHGAGLARKPFLVEDGAHVAHVARRLKRAFDPDGIMNPGKLYD
ncbi:alkyldihydroxyacetonephosphate synthase [Microbacterium sp. SLBN-154]|uniref:FAD-binding oxidoreductase n=1 Tax=Microbacterium sp. SLBN-154 TaxID=2768458 RepID=UPI00114ED31C|nr:FAD-binding oxidoreductase [Microbacterium sp. SLBN-154]TQK17653.1 alkyldihydroxyacetonephosphate synthase [Microbacterium sp. SLBN-154]